MLDLVIRGSETPLKVLFLGAHCDDIEIGCGATIRSLISSGRDIDVYWTVLSSTPKRAKEAELCASRFLEGARKSVVAIEAFRNGYFPYVGAELKDYFELLRDRFDPDLIFTHYGLDRHQDHRTVCELTWNTYRNHWILEYEIPKYDGDIGNPNLFTPIGADDAEFKISSILECFKSQSHRKWFERSTFEALMRLRGVECNSNSGYAEAFYTRKTTVCY